MDTVQPGFEIPTFERMSGFHAWNRFAAVNEEFVPMHMDDEGGRAAGSSSAFGMGNLLLAYVHAALRQWVGDNGRIVSVAIISSTELPRPAHDRWRHGRRRSRGERGDGGPLGDLDQN